tara:strand:+ start:832 stop:1824 length:993 start_codon:yes stop_codon:yes gene_type:complete
MKKNIKVLVTGGAGFIGAHVVQKLIQQNFKVMAVDSMDTIGGIPYKNPKSKFIVGNILNEQIIKKIKNWKPKIIFHLAAQSGGESAYDDPKKDYLANGYGTYLLASMAREIGVKQFIYTSSVAVYGSNLKSKITEKSKINPDSIYGISKYIGEMFIKQILYKSKTKTSIFRVFNSYGPGEDLNYLKKGMVSIYCSYVWKNKPILVKGSLERFRNYQYIDDVVNILVKSIFNKRLKKNETINLTTGKTTKVKELIKLILKTNNKQNYKVIERKKGTQGDSFGFDASNRYLKTKFPDYKFISIESGIKKYFKWINKIPIKKDLKNYHPFRKR